MLRYSVVQNPIVSGVEVCLRNRLDYFVVRMTRESGKTHSITHCIVELLKQNTAWVAFIVSETKNQTFENLSDSGYLKKFGVDPSGGWKRTKSNNGWIYEPNGSVIIIGGTKDALAMQRNRGKHPNIIYHDEAQSFKNPYKWVQVFGPMGKSKHCLKILSGTGGLGDDNLLTFVENQIKAEAVSGKVLKKTILDLIEEDEGESRQARKGILEEAKKMYTTFKEIDGEMVPVIRAEESPEFRREYLVEDVEGNSLSGGLAFPSFKEKEEKVIEEDYEIRFDSPIFIACDYGSTDPCGATLTQVVGDEVHTFAEIYLGKGGGKNVRTFAPILAQTLEDLGLIKCENWEKESQTGDKEVLLKPDITYIHKEIYFLGDQHGSSNWNHYLEQYFLVRFNEVAPAADGVDLIEDFIKSEQWKVSIDCPTLLKQVRTTTMEEDRKLVEKYHLPIKHTGSHLVITIAYLLYHLVHNGVVPVVSSPEDKQVVQLEPKKEEKSFIPLVMMNGRIGMLNGSRRNGTGWMSYL